MKPSRSKFDLSRPLFGILIGLTLATFGCAAPEPVRMVAFLDASASSIKLRPRMKAFLEDIVGRLDRHLDKLVVYRMSNTVSLIYAGEAWRGPALRNNLEAYIKEPPTRGTSYGAALRRSVKESEFAKAEKRLPVVLILGDAEDEPGPGTENMTPANIPGLVKGLGPQALLSFVFATPTDRFSSTFEQFQNAFGASYDERLQFSTPESEDRHVVRNFLLEKLKR